MWIKSFLLLLMLGTSPVWSQSGSGLEFIQNNNQWDVALDFQAKIPGGRMAVSAQGFSIYLLDQEKLEKDHLDQHQQVNESDGMPSQEPTLGHYFQINFLGANPNSRPITGKALPGYYNYFLGNDSCRWAGSVPAFSEVTYPEIYAGIDLKVSSMGQNLKYDFVVKAGADPTQIKIEYCGVDGMEKHNGDITIKTSLGILTEKKPYVYQAVDNVKNTVSSEYRLSGNILSFSFPEEYDPCHDLVVDPLLIFSTYSGSLADNWGSTATPGEHGTVYTSGVTNHQLGSTIEGGPFPTTVGAFQTTYGGKYDIAIIKYDSAGTHFLYATYLGGTESETPHSLVVDKNSGNLIVLGRT
jgi:hypothetical protein